VQQRAKTSLFTVANAVMVRWQTGSTVCKTISVESVTLATTSVDTNAKKKLQKFQLYLCVFTRKLKATRTPAASNVAPKSQTVHAAGPSRMTLSMALQRAVAWKGGGVHTAAMRVRASILKREKVLHAAGLDLATVPLAIAFATTATSCKMGLPHQALNIAKPQ
jgi:hypothetical protein